MEGVEAAISGGSGAGAVRRGGRLQAEAEQENLYESVEGVAGGWVFRRGCVHARAQTLEFNAPHRHPRRALVPDHLWVGTMPLGRVPRGVWASCGTIDVCPYAPRLRPAVPAPAAPIPAPVATVPKTQPQPSCSYHMLPESHRSQQQASASNSRRDCCDERAESSGSECEDDSQPEPNPEEETDSDTDQATSGADTAGH